jgi:hypothetical protein
MVDPALTAYGALTGPVGQPASFCAGAAGDAVFQACASPACGMGFIPILDQPGATPLTLTGPSTTLRVHVSDTEFCAPITLRVTDASGTQDITNSGAVAWSTPGSPAPLVMFERLWDGPSTLPYNPALHRPKVDASGYPCFRIHNYGAQIDQPTTALLKADHGLASAQVALTIQLWKP